MDLQAHFFALTSNYLPSDFISVGYLHSLIVLQKLLLGTGRSTFSFECVIRNNKDFLVETQNTVRQNVGLKIVFIQQQQKHIGCLVLSSYQQTFSCTNKPISLLVSAHSSPFMWSQIPFSYFSVFHILYYTVFSSTLLYCHDIRYHAHLLNTAAAVTCRKEEVQTRIFSKSFFYLWHSVSHRVPS